MAAKDFTLYKVADTTPMITLDKASATVIEAGDMVGLTNGLAVKAGAATSKIAYAPFGAGDGDTEIQVVADPNALYLGTADANFAVTDRGAEVDMVVTSSTQYVDIGASSTDVFLVYPGTDDNVATGATPVVVKINKPLF